MCRDPPQAQSHTRTHTEGCALGYCDPRLAAQPPLELAAAAVEAVNAGIDQETGIEKTVEKRGLHIHGGYPNRLVSCLWTSSIVDVLPRMMFHLHYLVC